MSTPVTFVLVGSGTAAGVLAQALQETENAELAAVFDNDIARATHFAKAFADVEPARQLLRVVPSWQSGHAGPAAISRRGHRLHREDMVSAARTGSPVMLDAREGKRALELINAVYRLAKSGRMVRI